MEDEGEDSPGLRVARIRVEGIRKLISQNPRAILWRRSAPIVLCYLVLWYRASISDFDLREDRDEKLWIFFLLFLFFRKIPGVN